MRKVREETRGMKAKFVRPCRYTTDRESQVDQANSLLRAESFFPENLSTRI